MFTGIIQAVGTVEKLYEGHIWLSTPKSIAPEGFEFGESLSVNGCCLTIKNRVGSANWMVDFDLSPETLQRTSFSCLKNDSKVNLERAMTAADRFGGHIVQGHVDTTATVVSVEPAENSSVIRFQLDPSYDRYLIDKGSITIDGVSLTVVAPEAGAFDTWIIPVTLSETTLGSRVPGDLVNIEFDMIAKYVEKLMGSR